MPRAGIVVLAAGRSTRFSADSASKLLAPVAGVPLVRLAVVAAVDANVGEVVVVTGDRASDVGAALDGVPVRIVHEPAFADGMARSLACGVRAIARADAVMIGLGDQPGMRPDAYRRIEHRWRASGAPIVVPRYMGSAVPSHPTLFDASLFPELLALEGDVGARGVIARHAHRVAEEALDWAAPEDVDTLEDLDEFLHRFSAHETTPKEPDDRRSSR
jgi:molybdenum cofactor cytidylyltransferase